MKKIFSILPVMAVVMLLAYACNKKNDVVEPRNDAAQFRSSVGCEECSTSCTPTPDSVVFNGDSVTWVAGPSRPGPFTTYYFDFTTGTASTSPTGAQISMTGEFNSVFKGIGCWKVAALPTSFSCASLDTACSYARANYDTALCTPNTIGSNTATCTGWYNYVRPVPSDPSQNYAQKIRCIVVFCDADGDGLWDSDEKGFVVCPNVEANTTEIDDSPLTYSLYSTYTFKYKCCPAL
jgi:hypothetical protein